MAQDGLQVRPRWPPGRSKRVQDVSKFAQEISETDQDGPKGLQEASNTAQEASKRPPRGPPRGPEEANIHGVPYVFEGL
eukprot:3989016-Pyramimonas_sp.AAC.1